MDFSLYKMENIERAKVDKEYMGGLILANEDLIWFAVHKYIGDPNVLVKYHNLDKDDILQLGRLGFIKSIKSFDTTRGIKFSSFAVVAIVREIRTALRASSSAIRPSRAAHALMMRIKLLEEDLGYLPSVEDISVLLDADTKDVQRALLQIDGIIPLDKTLKGNGKNTQPTTISDFIQSEEDVEVAVVDKVFEDYLLSALEPHLTADEKHILRMRANGYKLTEIASMYNTYPMRISRILRRIERKAREVLGRA